MRYKQTITLIICGICAGIINGLFGAGGGMVLVPLLTMFADLHDDQVFPASVCIILPICIVSLVVSSIHTEIPWKEAIPYLLGSAVGGVAAGFWGKHIKTSWLHKILGIMILWGGIRYLW